VTTVELKSSLAQFVTFAGSLKGDEKSEAQPFLDHFFRALGHAGAIGAGATFTRWRADSSRRAHPSLGARARPIAPPASSRPDAGAWK
jgi:hypothetical protein